jgi:hypothetical protein
MHHLMCKGFLCDLDMGPCEHAHTTRLRHHQAERRPPVESISLQSSTNTRRQPPLLHQKPVRSW